MKQIRKEVTMYKRLSALVHKMAGVWAGRVQKRIDEVLLMYRAEVV